MVVWSVFISEALEESLGRGPLEGGDTYRISLGEGLVGDHLEGSSGARSLDGVPWCWCTGGAHGGVSQMVFPGWGPLGWFP